MTTASTQSKTTKGDIDALFGVGAHYGYKKTRRHPSTEEYIFGMKNTVEIFDLEKTHEKFEAAKAFVGSVAEAGGQVLVVSGKPEAKEVIVKNAGAAGMPFVAGRWIGGTLTNFPEIRKRVDKLEKLREQKEKGELAQYTKHEQLLISREIAKLELMFGGIVVMKALPKAVFAIDPKEESTAVREATRLGIPVVALANTDCDISGIQYPIPANDSNVKSIEFFVKAIAEAIAEGAKKQKTTKEASATAKKPESK